MFGNLIAKSWQIKTPNPWTRVSASRFYRVLAQDDGHYRGNFHPWFIEAKKLENEIYDFLKIKKGLQQCEKLDFKSTLIINL